MNATRHRILSIHFWQLPPLSLRVPRLMHALGPCIGGWGMPQTRQVVRKAHQTPEVFLIVSLSQFNIPHPDRTPAWIGAGVKAENGDKSACIGSSSFNTAVWIYANGFGSQNLARVRQLLDAFEQVARVAGIQKIIVRYPQFRAIDLRSKVLNIKLAGHSPPLFAEQTVDASKGKLVAEPWAVGSRIIVALRAMTALMWQGWIIERGPFR